jgi:nucleotide-binding universal stress UspA family protein
MLENEIVVGLDDSASAQAALQWAARYARFTYTDVRVIHVSTCSIGAALTLAAGFPGMEAFVPPEPGHLQELTIQQMFEAVHPEPDWVLEYRDGRPGQVLVSESHHAQLLIIGTRAARRPRQTPVWIDKSLLPHPRHLPCCGSSRDGGHPRLRARSEEAPLTLWAGASG